MKHLKTKLRGLEKQDLLRTLRLHDDHPGRIIEFAQGSMLNFSSNNYLGLANHKDLIAAAAAALSSGTGSTASRLITGNLRIHEQLEAELATFHHVPAARLFGSGYQANLGLLSSVASAGDLIVSDRLNHASVIDGCRLSGAKVLVARHRDLASFEAHLKTEIGGQKFVVTESIFSMDGDLAPLTELRSLCSKYQAYLIVDEAHAVGAMGPAGRGICAQLGVVPDALVGGLGKAFGSFGGYVAGSIELCEFLLNSARSFVFSTALPPAVVAASLAALRLIRSEEGERLRAKLRENMRLFLEELVEIGLAAPGTGDSPVFPVVLGSATTALYWMEELLSQGIYCQAIRPPTVEPGRCRLRIALSSVHQPGDIAKLAASLARLQS